MGWLVLSCFVLLIHAPSYTCSSSVLSPLCNHDDSSNLLQFKNSFAVNTSFFKDRFWPRPYCFSYANIASWKNGTDCCNWDGVTCDTMSGHVIGLDLSCSMLRGEFHPNSTLFQLTHLQQLNLAFIDFSNSPIYPGVGDFVCLTHLNLSYSAFSGEIPSTISHLSKLVSLDLSTYIFRENILTLDPSTWNRLILNTTNLKELVLNNVNMSSVREDSLSLLMNLSSSLVSLSLEDTELQGNFPTAILGLPNLQELILSGNSMLRGKLPKSNWSAPLRVLDLSSTAFSGEIPDSIGQLESLKQISLNDCNFGGLVPPSFWNLTQLTTFTSARNRLHGEIPSLFSNLKHLITLDLQENNFSGHIPDVFTNFTKLDFLTLSHNNLGGQLPPSLFQLTQLSNLDLSFNHLEGLIPSQTTKVSELVALHLDNNLLNGTIPHWCYSLPLLKEFSLSNNKLVGPINGFSTHSMTHLLLSNNKLQGGFPNSIFVCENLLELDLSSNDFNGLVDFHQFSNLKSLVLFDISHNHFLSINYDNSSIDYFLPNLAYVYLSFCKITKFPRFLERIQDLNALDLSNNQIEGVIPKWLSDNLLHKWKRIYFTDLSFNKLQGDLPIPPYGIVIFSVSNNNFTGHISSAICNASFLHALILSHNHLSGMIPQCLVAFPSLVVLDLQVNNLQGLIPANFSQGNVLQTIKLNHNQLEGPLPMSLANCTMLEVLDVAENNIEDVFPNWLKGLQELQVLSLRANKFHGSITSFDTKLPFSKLRIFDVSNNKFSGPLPTSFFQNFQGMKDLSDSAHRPLGLSYMNTRVFNKEYNDSVVVTVKGQFIELVRILTTFTTIDLSNNMFEGEISHVIGELSSLKGLNLSHNKISGMIPQTLGNLTSLEWLDLSWNQLKGEIPIALTNLNFLSVLNLSGNQLEGMIPTGKQFNTFQNDSYRGNPMLCGFPLSKSCNSDEEQPPSVFSQAKESLFGWKAVAVGYGCGVVFGMFLGRLFMKTAKPLWLARLLCGYN